MPRQVLAELPLGAALIHLRLVRRGPFGEGDRLRTELIYVLFLLLHSIAPLPSILIFLHFLLIQLSF